MTLNRIITIAGFLAFFTLVSHANDFGKLLKDQTHAPVAQAQVTVDKDLCRNVRY